MVGIELIALATLILLLLPVVILPWEGRKVPDALFLLIGTVGLARSFALDGIDGVLWSAAAGILCLMIIAAAVSAIRDNLKVQLLTGGHIKLLGAGATWLGLGGAIAMLAMAFITLFAIGLVEKRKTIKRRPDFFVVAALTIIGLNIQQNLSLI